MDESTIISIKDFRKLAGFTAEQCSDEEVLDLIRRLDTMAQLYIKSLKSEPEREE